MRPFNHDGRHPGRPYQQRHKPTRRDMQPRAVLLTVLTTLLLAGCITADPVDDSIPPTAPPAFDLDATHTFASTNMGVTVAYSIDYPAGWVLRPDTNNGILRINRVDPTATLTGPPEDDVTLEIQTPLRDARSLEAYTVATLGLDDASTLEPRRLDGRATLRRQFRAGDDETVVFVLELDTNIYLTMQATAARDSPDTLLIAADAVLRSLTVLSLTVAE